MKLWRMMALGLMVCMAGAARAADLTAIKAQDGKTLALVLTCNDCQSGASKSCQGGAEQGWVDGKPCGRCLVDANNDVLIRYPYDLHIAGKLVDTAGNPVKDRFVKLFMPNGWGVRTRTVDDGSFRLMLGATAERESKAPLSTDLGTLVDSKKEGDQQYALFLMPENYKPCAAKNVPAPQKKASKQGKK